MLDKGFKPRQSNHHQKSTRPVGFIFLGHLCMGREFLLAASYRFCQRPKCCVFLITSVFIKLVVSLSIELGLSDLSHGLYEPLVEADCRHSQLKQFCDQRSDDRQSEDDICAAVSAKTAYISTKIDHSLLTTKLPFFITLFQDSAPSPVLMRLLR